jgi:hypothetical protein
MSGVLRLEVSSGLRVLGGLLSMGLMFLGCLRRISNSWLLSL